MPLACELRERVRTGSRARKSKSQGIIRKSRTATETWSVLNVPHRLPRHGAILRSLRANESGSSRAPVVYFITGPGKRRRCRGRYASSICSTCRECSDGTIRRNSLRRAPTDSNLSV